MDGECMNCGEVGNWCKCDEEPMTFKDKYMDMIEKFEDEYSEFENIPKKDRLHPHEKLCGLLKLATFIKDDKFEMVAEHDHLFLFCGKDLDKTFKDITEEDLLYLHRCGIGYDDEYKCLRIIT